MPDSHEDEPTEEEREYIKKISDQLDMCEKSVDWAKTEIDRISEEVKINPSKKAQLRVQLKNIARKLDVEKKIIENLM